MPAPSLHTHDHSGHLGETTASSQPRFRRVVACLDTSRHSPKVISHGVAVATALNAELTLLRVLEAEPKGASPSDPVEWALRRLEACAHVEDLAHERAEEIGCIQTAVVEGRAANQICQWAREHQADLTVLCSHGEDNGREWDLGTTARRIIDCAPGSVLLVPAQIEESRGVRYRRLLVPLDGSSRAESALPIALRLTEAKDTELLLVHAVPEPELTEIGPFEPDDIDLRERLFRRNERVAQSYLDRIRTGIADKGVSVRTLILRGGDARYLLSRAIVDETADLVILASHGHSGHVDVSAGSVAAYLMAHTPVPLLIVRQHSTSSSRHDSSAQDRIGIRLPSRTIS